MESKIKKIYALYKGDNYITDGTKEELAKYLNVKVRTIEFYLSPTYAKRGRGINGNRKKVIYLGGWNKCNLKI